MNFVLLAISLMSIAFNVGLLFLLKRKQKRPQSIELKEFLGDMLSGGAMIAVKRVDTDGLMMRSPKHR